MTGSLARLLIRLYPRAWRKRYEDEMLALVDESGASVGTLVDLVVALSKQWLVAIVGWTPSEATRLNWAGLRDMFVICAAGIGLSLLSVPTASWLHRMGVRVDPSAVGPAFLVMILAPIRGIAGLASWPEIGLSPRWAIGRVELALWFVALFVSALLIALDGGLPAPWWQVALKGLCLQSLALVTTGQVNRHRRLRELRELAKAGRRLRSPRYPLGLGPHNHQ